MRTPLMSTEPPIDPSPENDLMLKMCVGQGYVPATCYLPGPIVWGLMQRGEDPCAGCNLDRGRCHGRPHREVPNAI